MLTNEEKEIRKCAVGASDVAKILGVSNYGTAYDVWLEKTGKLDGTDKDNPAIEIGNVLEPALIDWAKAKHPGTWFKQVRKAHKSLPLASTYDALNMPMRAAIEAKTGGIANPFGSIRDQWGEPGTDQIPDAYLLQCQAQIMCADLEVVHVPALIGGRGLHMYEVRPHRDLIEIIGERVTAFWECVTTDTPPEGWPTLDVARHIRREEGKRVEVPLDIFQSWREAAARKSQAEKDEKEEKAKLLALMMDASVGFCETGEIRCKRIQMAGHVVGPHEKIDIRFAKGKA
jgi:putative phage-type endonuclease